MAEQEMCVECGVEPVTGFRGYAKYNLCFECGRARAKANKESGNQPWKEKTLLKKMRAEQRKKEMLDEASTREEYDGLKLRNAQALVKKKVAKDDYSFIPPHMRWVALNPAVTIPEEKMTDRDTAKEQVYVQRVGRPSRLAENVYRMVKGNEKALWQFFNKVDGMYVSYQKKRESQNKLEDVKQVDDIWKMLDECIKPDGVVPKARREGKLPERVKNSK